MRRKALCLALCCMLALPASCGQRAEKYTGLYYGMFDTQIALSAYCDSQERFNEIESVFVAEMERLNGLFDIYGAPSYSEGANLRAVNDSAGAGPVEVGEDVLELLKLGMSAYAETGGALNIALGPVTALWHDVREKANAGMAVSLPTMESLKEAYSLCDIEDVVIDEDALTVQLRKAGMRLDVGAIAKGYATQKAMEKIRESATEPVLIDAGGNVLASGAPPNDAGVWRVGVRDPSGDEEDAYLDVLNVTESACVTSGSYQRYFTYGGKRYSHIIDTKTLLPAEMYESVTVIADDSAIADMLSTALFAMSIEDGRALLKRHGAEAIWAGPNGVLAMSAGYSRYSEYQR